MAYTSPMKPAAALLCALSLAAPLSAQPDSQARQDQRADARQAAAEADAKSDAKAEEHGAEPDGAPEGIGPAEEGEGGKAETSDKVRQKLEDLSKLENEKALQKAQSPTEMKNLTEAGGGLKGPPGADSPGAFEQQAKSGVKNGGAKRNGAVPGSADARGAGGGRTAVTKQAVTDPSRIPTTASGRKTIKLMSRWGGALGQEYKTTEPGLSFDKPADKPDYRPAGKPSDKFAAPAPFKTREMDDLSLAALSGRSRALGAMGLRVEPGADGKPRVLRRDGTPATPEQAQAAVRALAQEPAALVRRPDFFQALPREHYEALRAAYEPSAPEFRDVGLQRQRDFQWTRSCSGVSGGCNPYSAESHYERGHDVSPETLETIYRRAEAPKAEARAEAGDARQAEAGGEDEPARDLGDCDEDDEKLVEAARAAEGVGERRSALGGVAARLKGLLSGLKLDGSASWSGDGRGEAAGSAVSARPAASGAAVPAPGSASAASPAPRTAGAPSAIPGSAPAPGNDAAPRRSRRGAGLLGLAAALLAAAAVLRRL